MVGIDGFDSDSCRLAENSLERLNISMCNIGVLSEAKNPSTALESDNVTYSRSVGMVRDLSTAYEAVCDVCGERGQFMFAGSRK